MDPNQQNQPQGQPDMMQTPKVQSKSIGPTIGILIIVLVIILGGLYFWGQRVGKSRIQPSVNTEQNQVGELPTQSNSDDASTIEADLNAASFDSLGSELNSIESAAQ